MTDPKPPFSSTRPSHLIPMISRTLTAHFLLALCSRFHLVTSDIYLPTTTIDTTTQKLTNVVDVFKTVSYNSITTGDQQQGQDKHAMGCKDSSGDNLTKNLPRRFTDFVKNIKKDNITPLDIYIGRPDSCPNGFTVPPGAHPRYGWGSPFSMKKYSLDHFCFKSWNRANSN